MKYVFLIFFIVTITCYPSLSQGNLNIVVEPNPLEVITGESAMPEVKVFISENEEIDNYSIQWQVLETPTVLRESGLVPSSGAKVDTTGLITGMIPGEYTVPVIVSGEAGFGFTYLQVIVSNSDISEIKVFELPEIMYSSTVVPLKFAIKDTNGFEIPSSLAEFSSDNEDVAFVDEFGNLFLNSEGTAEISITAGEISSPVSIKVIENPVEKVMIEPLPTVIRTGDVVQVKASLLDKKEKSVDDIIIQYSVRGKSNIEGSGAGAQILQDGRFVAEQPGTYMISVSSGNRVASKMIEVVERNVERSVELTGQGSINTKHTSDFWVWEGVDGKDYAVTGTWGADGKAYFWEVTNPSNIILLDSVQVDARTVNDVKISEDGTVCIISREGASNRKNGIVIYDVTNPKDVKELTTYTEYLTGGVHNLFIYKDHVYALSNGQKYEIINIEDPSNPKRVGKFEIDNPARSIHDVWIEDGIAYSSNWNDGVIIVDVGNGVAGGSPSNPVEIGRYKVEGNANHAAFPFTSKSTGKKYVIAGDEIFPREFLADPDAVIIPSGYLHFIDITDPENPVEVAKYEVPEAGSHNYWVEGDVLYIGYYNGGLRVVDISGDLVGDLYNQGREIAVKIPFDKNGFVPNAPFIWGAQPHKGHVFFSDFNSGLWSVKIEPVVPDETSIQSK